jgi:hypothetical protein
MKFLGLLALLQIALISLLFLRLDSIESQVDELAAGSAPAADLRPLAGAGERTGGSGEQAGMRTGADHSELRRLIREELEAFRGDLAAQQQEPAAEPPGPIIDEAEMRYRRDLVRMELEYLKEQGDVSTGELDRLMGNIARLDPEGRTEMLGLLNQALNRGEIRGQL